MKTKCAWREQGGAGHSLSPLGQWFLRHPEVRQWEMVIATGIVGTSVNYYCHVGDNFSVRESEGRKLIERDYTQRALVPGPANAEKIRAFTAAKSAGTDVVEVTVWEPLRQLARERMSGHKRASQIAAAEARKREQG